MQTHESIRTNMIEEAYELVAAINNKDVPNMLEECGDVLLQALFHANIAERSGEFDFNDVVHRLCYKLVSRHTHIFGEDKAVDAADALKVWEKAKAKEKTEDLASKLYKIECSTPTLVYAKKAVKELKKAGLLVSDNKVSAEQLLPFVIGLCNSGVDLEAELREQLNDKIKECLGETSKN